MKKLLLVILSLSVLGQFDMTSAMKREFNQEQEEEKSNKKIKTETTLKKLSKDEILHIFKFLKRRSADNFMQVEKRFYNIFDDVKNPETILNFTLSDELENMNLDDKITKIIQINKKLLTALIKNIDTQEANDILIWATGNSDITLVKELLKNTDFLNLINRRGANDSVGWASENGDDDIVETLLTNSIIAGLVNYGIANGLEWAARDNCSGIWNNRATHVPVFLALLTFAPNSCSNIISTTLTSIISTTLTRLIANDFQAYLNEMGLFKSMIKTCLHFAHEKNLSTSMQKLLSYDAILGLIDTYIAHEVMSQVYSCFNQTSKILCSNATIIELTNDSNTKDLLNTASFNSTAKTRALLMNDSILNKIMRPIENAYILEFFLQYDRYHSRTLGDLLIAKVANKILMFAVKNKLYLQNNQNSVFQKLLENKTFMNCINAEGAQDALDEAPLYEMYELLEQNKQIRKLLKLDYSCLVQ